MTDRIDALRALKSEIKDGNFPGGINGLARQVFPYKSASFDDMGLRASEAFDGSLDAARALHEAVLPGWFFSVYGSTVVLERKDAEAEVDGQAKGDPARAWLLAILAALISEAENG